MGIIPIVIYLYAVVLQTELTHGHDTCPRGDNWRRIKNICIWESGSEMTYQEGSRYCRHIEDSDMIPVEKLRNLKNNFDPNGRTGLKLKLRHSGQYHVDAMKNWAGEWRSSDKKKSSVSFNQFPHFNALHGDEGETLIWNPDHNSLHVADKNEKHRVLCYKKTQRQENSQCPGYKYDRECSNSGDCVEGSCVCDIGFGGSVCQEQVRNDVELLIVGIAQTGAPNTTILYNFEYNKTCVVSKPVPALSSNGYLTYLDDKVYACNDLSECYTYDSVWKIWIGIGNLHVTRIRGSSNLVPTSRSKVKTPKVPGLNYGWPEGDKWWISGGTPTSTSRYPFNTSETITHSNWEYSVGLPDGLSLLSFCTVQISPFETALIGGVQYYGVANKTNNYIYVYNWGDKEWKIRADLPYGNMRATGCGLITAPTTGKTYVAISGGVTTDPSTGISVALADTWLWDPESNHFTSGIPLPNTSTYVMTVQYTDNMVISFGSRSSLSTAFVAGIYSFTIDDGWKLLAPITGSFFYHRMTLVPKGLFTCL